MDNEIFPMMNKYIKKLDYNQLDKYLCSNLSIQKKLAHIS